MHLQVGTAVNIAQTEGASAFFKGLSPAVMRGLFYGGELAAALASHASDITLTCQLFLSQTLQAQDWGATHP